MNQSLFNADSPLWQSIWLSIVLACITTAFSLFAAIPLAAWLTFTRSRLAPAVDALVMLPLCLPPTVVGFYALLMFAPNTLLGRALLPILGEIPFSFTGLVLVAFFLNIPFAVRPLVAAFVSIPRKYIESALLLHPSRMRLVLKIMLPMSRGGLVTSASLVAVHTMGEFGAAMMIGGAIPGRTRTLSISLYNDVQSMNYAAAHTAAAVMVLISLAAVALVFATRPKQAHRYTKT